MKQIRNIRSGLRSRGATYQVLGHAGMGGTAGVLKVSRVDGLGYSEQTVAAKILKDKNDVSLLRNEFEALSKVQSQHCARLLCFDDVGGRPALILEWIDGLTLKELDSKTALSDSLISEILSQVQTGLQDLHSTGLIHGDVSPSNIMIDRHGNVRLIDFGSMTIDRETFYGTPAYMATETWLTGEKSWRSDLFALGLIENELFDERIDGMAPSTADESKKRAFNIASENKCGWLALDSTFREYKVLSSSKEQRSQLAALVRNVMDQKNKVCFETVKMQVAKKLGGGRSLPHFLRPYAASILVFCSLILFQSFPSEAQAPMVAEPFATVSFQTQKWMMISINGSELGYTPIQIKNMRPGRHRLSWKSATGAGSVILDVQPGQTLRLSENELLKSAQRSR